MRYIGGKSLLLENINNVINSEIPNVSSVIDLFAGSGIVSNNFKMNGYRTISNDFLYFSYVISRCSVMLNKKPSFQNLGITDPISYLNNLKIIDTDFKIEDCFIYNNYSPVGECSRMYFQPANAMKIDIIRLTIENWHNENLITEDEYFYLLSSLINAVPFVSNITGVYAAYLKFWDERTYKTIQLTEPIIISNGKKNESYNTDFTNMLSRKCDLLYADPPYNSREYLPNYHILETIARYDYPEIHGITGMRNYDKQKSVFCKKNTVASAFETMIKDCKSRYILISYNNEALLSTQELSYICKTYAVDNSFKLFEFDYRRYKNKIPNNKKGLKEQLYFLRRH
jgi:adenine-specific DNA-methyltransferase